MPVRPAVGGDIPDAGAHEHRGVPSVREATDHAGAAAVLPTQSLDYAVRA